MIIWKRVALPPQILIGQADPVVLSTPTMSCQPPVVKKPLGVLRAVELSKPDLNRRFAESCAAAGGGTTGVGAGAGGETVTGGTTGVGAGAGGETATGGTTGVGAGAGEGAGAVG